LQLALAVCGVATVLLLLLLLMYVWPQVVSELVWLTQRGWMQACASLGNCIICFVYHQQGGLKLLQAANNPCKPALQPNVFV
jgi:hypothetical protein